MRQVKEPKSCYDCPFFADTYAISYKTVDEAPNYCTFYDKRIEPAYNDDFEPLFPLDFCKVTQIIIETSETLCK